MKKSQIVGLVILSTFILIQVSLPAICFENNYTESPSLVRIFPSNSNELMPNSNDDHIIYHNMEVKIQLDHSLHVASSLVIENSENATIDYFQYVINDSISNVFVSDPIGSLEFSWNIFEDSSVINVTMRYPLLEGQKYVITIAYFLTELQPFFIQEPSEFYTLEYAIFHYLTTQKFDLEIHLPLGYGLIEGESPRPTYPIPERVYTEDNIVKISWSSLNILPNFEYLYTIRFQETDFTFPIPTPTSPYIYIYILLAFLGGAAISSLVFFLIIKRKYHPEKSELVSSLLSDSEQAVIKAINDEGGVAIQRRICERTSFSKSKVSQILLKLEEKNVLKRERWGRTNKVTITNPTFLNIELESKAVSKKESDFDD